MHGMFIGGNPASLFVQLFMSTPAGDGATAHVPNLARSGEDPQPALYFRLLCFEAVLDMRPLCPASQVAVPCGSVVSLDRAG